MVITPKRLHRTIARLSITAIAFASFGAAVIAAPSLMNSKLRMAKTEIGQLAPLASGPAIQLAKAGPGESEDCVRVTRMTGADGKEYPTNGIVCAGE